LDRLFGNTVYGEMEREELMNSRFIGINREKKIGSLKENYSSQKTGMEENGRKGKGRRDEIEELSYGF